MGDFAKLIDQMWGTNSPELPANAGQIILRSGVVFFVGLALIRIGKSRLLTKASALDVLIGVILGSLLSRAITGSATLSNTVVACGTLVAIHWVISALSYRYHWLGNLVKGHAHALIENGQIQWDNLRRSHISEHDLHEQMRLNANVDDPSKVLTAIKERSGQVGVVKFPPQASIMSIEVHEGVQTVRIEVSYRN